MKWCAVILFAFLCCYARDVPATDKGTETTIKKYPFVVQVQNNGQLKCVGIIVDKQNIVSVAHCFVDDAKNKLDASSFTVRYGASELGSGGTVVKVSSITIRDDYNTPVRDNDIAVLKLSSPVTLGDNVKVATIPPMGQDVGGELDVQIVNWDQKLSPKTKIREYNFDTIDREECSKKFQNISTEDKPYKITKNMFCAVSADKACVGVDGKPVVYNNRAIGMSSWGLGCAEPRLPLVNVRFGLYIDWIKSTISKNNA